MTVARTNTSRRPRGDGSIYWVESRRRWAATVEDESNDRRRRVVMYGRTKSEVAQKLRAYRDNRRLNPESNRENRTVVDLIDQWLHDVAPLRQSPKTVTINTSLVRTRIRPAIGSIPIDKVRPEHVEKFLKQEAAAGLSYSTILKERSILTQAFRLAEQRRLITWNPARLANLPPRATVKPPRAVSVLNIDEARQLLALADTTRLGPFVAIALTTGLRPGEIAGLEWSNVDLVQGRITIRQALTTDGQGKPVLGPTKTRTVRVIAIPDELVRRLTAWRTEQECEASVLKARPPEWADLVVTTNTGNPLDLHNLRHQIRRLGQRIGIEGLTPYAFRHTTCSILSDRQVPLESIADLLGHRDTRMAMRHYRHVIAPTIDVAVATGVDLLRPFDEER